MACCITALFLGLVGALKITSRISLFGSKGRAELIFFRWRGRKDRGSLEVFRLMEVLVLLRRYNNPPVIYEGSGTC